MPMTGWQPAVGLPLLRPQRGSAIRTSAGKPFRPAAAAVTLVTAVTLAVTLLAAGCDGSPAAPGRPAGAGAAAGPSGTQAGRTTLAALQTATARFARPHGNRTGKVPATWYGARSVLPVVATRPGWTEVRLAQRPNNSRAWVPSSGLTMSSTPYRIVIDLASTHLDLYKNGRRIMSAPAGVGTTSDPTPAGHYFVAFLEAPPSPNPGYGAFIIVTSAHSESITNWQNSGDAVIGIHGPLGSDQAIGRAGARISHGCVRLHERDLLQLRLVPPGTPIDIVR